MQTLEIMVCFIRKYKCFKVLIFLYSVLLTKQEDVALVATFLEFHRITLFSKQLTFITGSTVS